MTPQEQIDRLRERYSLASGGAWDRLKAKDEAFHDAIALAQSLLARAERAEAALREAWAKLDADPAGAREVIERALEVDRGE